MLGSSRLRDHSNHRQPSSARVASVKARDSSGQSSACSGSLDDPSTYVLVEAFRDGDSGGAHVSSDHFKAAQTEQEAASALVAQLVQQRSDNAGVTSVAVRMLGGDTTLRSMKFNPDGTSLYDLPAKDIKARLRASIDR